MFRCALDGCSTKIVANIMISSLLGSDFQLQGSNVTFTDVVNFACVSVSAFADDIIEETESFSLLFSSSDAVFFSTETVIIDILDETSGERVFS